MGNVRRHPPVKLIAGFIYNKGEILDKAIYLLKRKFGNIDYKSPELDFSYTDYYKNEFGENLLRTFVSFQRLIQPDELPRIKLATNLIEKRLSAHKRRLINIDPGYIDQAKLILATTKDYCHRIYLNHGIFAELTLFYRDKTFAPLHPESPVFQNGDEGHIKLESAEKPRSKGRGVTGFTAWEWTYPDYRTQEYISAFNEIRDIYSAQIKGHQVTKAERSEASPKGTKSPASY